MGTVWLCLVLHCALQRQPGKRFGPDGGEGQSVVVPMNEKEKHERQVLNSEEIKCVFEKLTFEVSLDSAFG